MMVYGSENKAEWNEEERGEEEEEGEEDSHYCREPACSAAVVATALKYLQYVNTPKILFPPLYD